MSLEKAIKHKKEFRRQYYGAGKFDRTCRPHGSCPYCYSNRTHRNVRRMLSVATDNEFGS
ncbi:MAG: hypothetical protein EBW87_04850 [Burkholderiaceae bacterium]|nr:hypothetical protein [Burkholderiaceae bacterium]